VIVAVDDRRDLGLVEAACAAAVKANARLMLIIGTPIPTTAVAFFSFFTDLNEEEFRHGDRRLLDDALARIQTSLPVTTEQLPGRAAQALRHVDLGPFDAIAVRRPSRGDCRRFRRAGCLRLPIG
jgi:hypothetical protein